MTAPRLGRNAAPMLRLPPVEHVDALDRDALALAALQLAAIQGRVAARLLMLWKGERGFGRR